MNKPMINTLKLFGLGIFITVCFTVLDLLIIGSVSDDNFIYGMILACVYKLSYIEENINE